MSKATCKLFGVFFKDLKLRCIAESGVAPEAVAEAFHSFEQGGSKVAPLSAAAVSNQSIQESMRLLLLVRAYQVQHPCTTLLGVGPQITSRSKPIYGKHSLSPIAAG